MFLESIDLIALNELENTSNNAPIKCFASRKKEQRKAFETIEPGQIKNTSKTLGWLLEGLAQRLLLRKEGICQTEKNSPRMISLRKGKNGNNLS